jgi:hypothetical protein
MSRVYLSLFWQIAYILLLGKFVQIDKINYSFVFLFRWFITNCCALFCILDENASYFEIDVLQKEGTNVNGVCYTKKFKVNSLIFFLIPS